VARQYYDVTTGEEIETSEEFIESLTHDSYVIQIPHLHPDHKSEVEQLLMIFDQRWITTADKRIMNFNEADYPERYREITRRLQSAIATSEVRRIMKTEDDILKELTSRERVIAKQSKALVEKDKALVEKDKALNEQQQALSEKDRMIEELQKRIQSLE
ncbi:hypothetical protein QUF58_10160, partial [Anaerolineales bacterium HSG24]|nr:hypothetical protein [Anaerolineales bacterium HSG24]